MPSSERSSAESEGKAPGSPKVPCKKGLEFFKLCPYCGGCKHCELRRRKLDGGRGGFREASESEFIQVCPARVYD